MRAFRTYLIALFCALGVEGVLAQILPPIGSTNLFNLTVTPPSNTISNIVYFASGATKPIVVAVNNRDVFTNINITAEFGTNIGPFALRFSDAGAPPDRARDDGAFTSNVRMPFTDVITNFTLNFRAIGEDVSFPNPDPTMPELARVTNDFAVTYTIVPNPPNDRFTNAFKIEPAGGLAVSSNSFAIMEAGEPLHAQVPGVTASVWWTWSPSVDTSVLIDTAGTSFRPVLAVYTGQSVASLTPVASSTNDAILRLPPNVVFDAVKGTTYRIAVASFDDSASATGNLRLRIAPGATPDTRPPTASISSPLTGVLVAAEQLVISGTAREVFDNDSGISHVLLQVNSGPFSNAVGTATWSGAVTLPPGTNFVRAYAVDFAGNRSLPDTVTIRYLSPTNDLFVNAVQLQGTSGLVNTLNSGSTKEAGEPLHANNEGGHSVWYRWRSSSSGELTLSTQNSSFDTLLAVYTETALPNLVSFASNDDAFPGSRYSQVILTVTSNQLYYVAVDGFGGESGTIALQHFFQPAVQGTFYSVTVNSSQGGTVSPPTGIYPANARVTLTAQPEPNYEFANWEGSVSSTNNPLTVTVSTNLTLTPRFRVSQFTDDFETGNLTRLPWTASGASAWFVQTNKVLSGRFSARSGIIGHDANSTLVLVTNTGPGTASFDLRVSCESYWDNLQFYLNGSLVRRWSGETNGTFSFPVPGGLNRFEWRYVKDLNFTGGEDAAFIDNLFLPPNNLQAATGTLSIVLFPEGAQVSVLGQTGRTYVVEASSDLRSWTPIGSKSSASGVVHFLDTRAASFTTRFYRAVVQ